jgi:NADPH:quinone reductase-like Zn-dependent oxidoreductase
MRAFVKDSFEDAGAVRQLPDPEPAAGELRVRVRAASLNPADAGAAAGYFKAFMECRFPYVPGDVS